MKNLILRGIAYLAWAIIAGELILLEVRLFNTEDQFSERGMVETLHALILLVSAVCAFIAGWRNPDMRPLAICIGLFFSALLVREQDQFFEIWLPHGIWKIPAGLLMLGLLAVLVRNWQQVRMHLDDFARSTPCVIFITGFMVLTFSRLLGRSEFWMAVMGESYARVVKNAAEEGLELFALGILMLGALELCFSSRIPASALHSDQQD